MPESSEPEHAARRVICGPAPQPRALKVDAAAIARRDQLAAELTSYYEFLITMYLPANSLKRPPEGSFL